MNGGEGKQKPQLALVPTSKNARVMTKTTDSQGLQTRVSENSKTHSERTNTNRLGTKNQGREYGTCDSRRPHGEHKAKHQARGIPNACDARPPTHRSECSKKLCRGREEARTRTTEQEDCQVRLECSRRGHQCDTNIPGNGGPRGRGDLGIASVAVLAPALFDI